MYLHRPFLLCCAVTIFIAADLYPQTQARAAFLDTPAQVIVPANYRSDRDYPLYVLLPATGFPAASFRHVLRHDLPASDAIVLLPAGGPTRAQYLPDFVAFVGWFEQRLLQDIAAVRARYSIDSRSIVLAGHSLGGDLGWALMLRNPELFTGAVMAGTRASYRPPEGALDTLAQRNTRMVFVVGRREAQVRADGLRAAAAAAESAGVRTRVRVVAGGHTYGPNDQFAEHIRWVSGHTELIERRPEPIVTEQAIARPERRDRRRITLRSRLLGFHNRLAAALDEDE